MRHLLLPLRQHVHLQYQSRNSDGLWARWGHQRIVNNLAPPEPCFTERSSRSCVARKGTPRGVAVTIVQLKSLIVKTSRKRITVDPIPFHAVAVAIVLPSHDDEGILMLIWANTTGSFSTIRNICRALYSG